MLVCSLECTKLPWLAAMDIKCFAGTTHCSQLRFSMDGRLSKGYQHCSSCKCREQSRRTCWGAGTTSVLRLPEEQGQPRG